jgi:hypothetical protein
MRKRNITTAVLVAAGLIGTSLAALAQPSVNGPSGTGPEGSPPGVVNGSGRQEPGTTTKAGHGSSAKMVKHHESKKSQNKM